MPLAGFTSFQGSKTTRKIMRVNNFAIFCELDRALTPVAPRARFSFAVAWGWRALGSNCGRRTAGSMRFGGEATSNSAISKVCRNEKRPYGKISLSTLRSVPLKPRREPWQERLRGNSSKNAHIRFSRMRTAQARSSTLDSSMPSCPWFPVVIRLWSRRPVGGNPSSTSSQRRSCGKMEQVRPLSSARFWHLWKTRSNPLEYSGSMR